VVAGPLRVPNVQKDKNQSLKKYSMPESNPGLEVA
jgi:hypothetical protein